MGLGYKLRKHIAKVLQARSKAVRAALARYNKAATAIGREELQYEEICEYSFLSEFDLLRDARQDIRTRPWATPAGRHLMDLHFKNLAAHEEINRLNVEIPRFVTYMCDEEEELQSVCRRLDAENAPLAYQVNLHRMERARFNSIHLKRLYKLAGDPRVSPIQRGTRLSAPTPPPPVSECPPSPLPSVPPVASSMEEDPSSTTLITPEELLDPEELDADDADADADAEEDAEDDEVWRQTYSLMNSVLVITDDSGPQWRDSLQDDDLGGTL